MTAAAEQFSLHPEPVWRDKANFIVNAPLPEENRYEQLWCRQVADDSFEICCIPFFLYDIALGDLVQTKAMGGRKYVLSHVQRPSGRYVFRVHFGRQSKQGEVTDDLLGLGALLEWSSATLLAVDAADQSLASRIADYLQHREDRGELLYETGQSI